MNQSRWNSSKDLKKIVIPLEVIEIITDFMGNKILGREFQVELLIELLAKHGYEVRNYG